MIVLHFYPNGEFSQGVDTSQQRRDKRTRATAHIPRLDPKKRDRYLQWVRANADILKRADIYEPGAVWIAISGYKYEVIRSEPRSCTLKWTDKVGKAYYTELPSPLKVVVATWELYPYLGSSNARIFRQGVSRKKLLSMTKSMSRNIRNGVYLMEQGEGGKDALSFLTLTLPSLSQDELVTCCANWDIMVRMFFDWLKVTVRRRGVQYQHVYCTEIQTKRLKSRHEYAPHLHIIYRGRKNARSKWVISPKEARMAWKRCIMRFIHHDFDARALENLQRIKKSAARYLSKYLSKGLCAIPNTSDESPVRQLVTHWGGMSRNVSAAIKQATQKFRGDGSNGHIANAFMGRIHDLLSCGLLKYYKKGFIKLGENIDEGLEFGLHVCSGCLSTPTFEGGLIPVVAYLYGSSFSDSLYEV